MEATPLDQWDDCSRNAKTVCLVEEALPQPCQGSMEETEQPDGGIMNMALVVDDCKLMRLIVSHSLKCEGYLVVEAENGKEALEKLTADLSIIITDLDMPVMNGLEFARAVRRERQLGAIPIVMLSGAENPPCLHELDAAGITAWESKPLRVTHLRALVRRFSCTSEN